MLVFPCLVLFGTVNHSNAAKKKEFHFFLAVFLFITEVFPMLLIVML